MRKTIEENFSHTTEVETPTSPIPFAQGGVSKACNIPPQSSQTTAPCRGEIHPKSSRVLAYGKVFLAMTVMAIPTTTTTMKRMMTLTDYSALLEEQEVGL